METDCGGYYYDHYYYYFLFIFCLELVSEVTYRCYFVSEYFHRSPLIKGAFDKVYSLTQCRFEAEKYNDCDPLKGRSKVSLKAGQNLKLVPYAFLVWSDLSNWKYSHNLKVESSLLLGGNVTTQKPGRLHLSSPEKTAPRRQEGQSGYTQGCNKGSRHSRHWEPASS